MEQVWLKNYQAGVPDEIDPDKFSSLSALFEESFALFADQAAFTNMGTTLSFAELEQASRHFAAYLQKDLNLKKGDRLALMMPNLLQYPVAMMGALRAGLVVVNVNPLYTPRELEHQLADAKVSVIVILANFAHTLSQVSAHIQVPHVIVTEIGDCFSWPKRVITNWVVRYVKKMVPKFHLDRTHAFTHVLQKGAQLEFSPCELSHDDIAFLQYTGGTTGVAKGAILTHRNMVANLEQANAWLSQSLNKKKQIIITALPLYHIFSLTANCLVFMKLGAHNILITNPRDIKQFIKELKKYPFTAITGVDTLFNALLNEKTFEDVDFSNLEVSLGGGMAVHHAVAERWHELTGSPLIEAYGLTEASPAVCINPMDLKAYNGTIGLPISSTKISIRDEQDQECGFNTVGELWIKGPQVMRGYWEKLDETAEVLTTDGWLKTGDMAFVNDAGFVKIVDRKKDMIIVSGFNVYPNEVEDIIAELEAVLEVAVVGIEHPVKGELVKAFVVKKNPELTEAQVLAHCQANLTGYKVPKEIEFVSLLPKTNVGKILRRALKS